MKGTDFRVAKLKGANFQNASIAHALFKGASLVDAQGIGPSCADVQGWEEVNLAVMGWEAITRLGDEGRTRDPFLPYPYWILDGYQAAMRAYQQLATALEDQGLKEEAERFAYRAQVMQRKVYWWRIWQEKSRFWSRVSATRAYLFSLVIWALSGYGYRFGRSLLVYMLVLIGFAAWYWWLSQSLPHPLGKLDALILSISDMIG